MKRYRRQVHHAVFVILGAVSIGHTSTALAAPAADAPSANWSAAELSDLSCAVRMMALHVYATEASKEPGLAPKESDTHLAWADAYNISFQFYSGRLSVKYSAEQLAAKAPEEFDKILLQSEAEQDDSNAMCLEKSAEFEADFINLLQSPRP
jgi:hypothetical protein